ncbi:MAG: hypothetical protein R3C15_19630 [Thermoleophilia bacterium]
MPMSPRNEVFNSYAEYYDNVVRPIRDKSPTQLRLDGLPPGADTDSPWGGFGRFRHLGRTWAVDGDTRIEALHTAYEALQLGSEPFREEPTRKGSSLKLTEALKAQLEYRSEYVYIYER